ncbi:MAG: hypothetical protein IPL78_06380 [Chloroflexi bacterium]|nr:hypothetical protein [Chloroflexota bacterium]
MELALCRAEYHRTDGQPIQHHPSNDTNDGAAEVPGAAFTVVVTNSSCRFPTFQVTISGQPANQLIFNGVKGATARRSQPACGVGRMGLYVVRQPAQFGRVFPGQCDRHRSG